jgi:hypothetical protein
MTEIDQAREAEREGQGRPTRADLVTDAAFVGVWAPSETRTFAEDEDLRRTVQRYRAFRLLSA